MKSSLSAGSALSRATERVLIDALRVAEQHRRIRRECRRGAEQRRAAVRLWGQTEQLAVETRARMAALRKAVRVVRSRADEALSLMRTHQATRWAAALGTYVTQSIDDVAEGGGGARNHGNAQTPDRSAFCVLIVEDHADARELLHEMLTLKGIDVRVASNGSEALNVLDTISGRCVIVTDLIMPECDGWSLIEAVRRHPVHRESRIIVLTAAAISRVPAGCSVLLKPASLEEILAALEV